MWHLIHDHQTISALVAYFLFSSAVDAMPTPDSTSSKGYQWLYKFLNTFAANIVSTFGKNVLPKTQSPTPTSNAGPNGGQGSQSH